MYGRLLRLKFVCLRSPQEDEGQNSYFSLQKVDKPLKTAVVC